MARANARNADYDIRTVTKYSKSDEVILIAMLPVEYIFTYTFLSGRMAESVTYSQKNGRLGDYDVLW